MSDQSHPLASRWHRLTAALEPDAAARDAVFHNLAAAYDGRDRHYHTLTHIQDLLQQLDNINLIDRTVTELAVWFHDVVYDVHRSDNELQSAAAALRFLAATSLAPDRQRHVSVLIEQTAEHTSEKPGDDPDRDAFLDADLRILGAPEDEYWAYAKHIRREYKSIPDLLYRPGRIKVLTRMLHAPRLFRTPEMHARHEEIARRNLQLEIDAWTRSEAR